jgi:broad specificity phosphatase PhoE
LTRILLVRHGNVEGIRPERFRGRADLPLTDRGLAEAQAVAERIAEAWRPAKVYTSPMQRCVETGRTIAKASSIESEVIDHLNDIDYGAWQFRSYEEAEKTDPELFAGWFETPHLVRFPNGESLQDMVARTADTLRLVLSRHVDDTVVMVGHTSVNRALLVQLVDQPLSAYWRLAQAPCCINEEGMVQVLRINETHHLRGLED